MSGSGYWTQKARFDVKCRALLCDEGMRYY